MNDKLIEINLANNLANSFNTNLDDNEYYSKAFLKILDSYMYLMPYWSGCMLNKKSNLENQNLKTRVHNNTVEGKFKITKHSTLNGLKDNMPMEISTKFYKSIGANSMSYQIEKSDGTYMPIEMIEDNWGCRGDNKNRRNTYQTRGKLIYFLEHFSG